MTSPTWEGYCVVDGRTERDGYEGTTRPAGIVPEESLTHERRNFPVYEMGQQ